MNNKSINQIQNLKHLVLFATILTCMGWATDAAAAHTFFCKATISPFGDFGPTSLSGDLVYDMGTVGSCTDFQHIYHFPTQCQDPANSACSTRAQGDPNFNSAQFWCAKKVPNGATIRAYAEVGNSGKYTTAQTKGVLINKPAVTKTTYDCDQWPGTWLDPPTPGNGNHARCIKNSCNAVSGVPPAPLWVSIGTAWASATGPAWVTDGSGNIWYGVPARATITIIRPPECHWQ